MVADLGATQSGYSDKSVESGTDYTYRIKAYNAAGSSVYSSEVLISTPKLPFVPLIPVVPAGTVVPPVIPQPTTKAPVVTPTGATVLNLYLGKAAYKVNGQTESMDTIPILKDGRILLPVRYVALPLGATPVWDKLAQKVTITSGSTILELWVGNNTARLNGVEVEIDATNANIKPVIVPPGRTMLPLRFIGESLGCTVE